MTKITTVCGGKRKVWKSRKAAIDFFEEGMYCCEGSESERYASIVGQLKMGLDVASDELL